MNRKLRDHEYVIIQGWMINKLKLTGIDLLLFALAFNFAQDGSVLEWSVLEDLCSWFAVFGPELKCEDLDYHLNNLKMRGYVNVSKEGFSVVRHIDKMKG